MYYMLFLIAFFIGLAAYAMFLHNKVMPIYDITSLNWHKIDAFLRRRINLIPHLLEAAKGYMQYEKEVMVALNKLRSHLRQYGSENIKGRIEAELALSSTVDKLLTASEQYPDLETKLPFVNAKKMLLTMNEEINKAALEYNTAAQELNAIMDIKINKYIISLFGISKLEYFK